MLIQNLNLNECPVFAFVQCDNGRMESVHIRGLRRALSVSTCPGARQQTRAEGEVGQWCCPTKVSARREIWSWAGLSELPQTEASALGLYSPMSHLSSDSGFLGGEYDLGQGASAEGSSMRETQLCTVSPQCSLPLGHGDFSSEGGTSDTTIATLTHCYPAGETTV